MNAKPTGEEENWDTEDSQAAVEPQFEDVIIEEEVVIESVTEEELQPPVAGKPLTLLIEVARGTVDQKDMLTYTGEVQL